MNARPSQVARSVGISRRGRNRSLAMVCVFFLGWSFQAFGQEATILGTVADPTGAIVSNVNVTVSNTDTGISRKVTTNEDGQYVAPDLHIGHYNVRAEATGFKTAEEKGIVLQVGDRTRVDFKFEVGSATQTITVEAATTTVQTDSSEQSNVVTAQQVSQLATNGRSTLTLFDLSPGTSNMANSRAAFTPVSGDNTVSVNGQRPAENLQLIDGGENLDRGGSAGSVSPSIDAVAEFRNMTSNYSAEYGLASAATVSMVVKSGTKQLHGSAWEYFRNDDLNARNYFFPAPLVVPELRYNVYGFNLGGQVPIAKSHPTFFFYNMEWRKEIDGGLLNQLVPLASEYPQPNGGPAVLPTTFNGKPSIATTPCDGVVCNTGAVVPDSIQFANCPGGVAPAGVKPGSPFPNNTIPGCMISSNAVALLTAGGKYGGIFPQPNSGAFFRGGNNSPTDLREEIARIDHTFNSKFSVFGHWISEQISQTYGTTQWSNDNVPSIADVFGNPSYSAAVHATHIISPTLLNEIAFNYNGNRIHIIPNNLIAAPSDFTSNRLFSGPNADNRIPAIALTGVTTSDYTANWTPWNNTADDYQVRDDLSWTKGAHQLKFGFSFAIYKKVQDAFADTEGQFGFNGLFTGYDYADFLLGYAQSYAEDGAKITGHWNNISPAAYVQDNWRVTHRLTLNLGLRWDGIPHTYEANHLSSNFYPNLYNPANAPTFWNNGSGNICSGVATATSNFGCTGPSPGLVAGLDGYPFYLNGIGIGGVNGIPKGLVNGGWNNWGPRLGFVYDLTGRGKTVLRAGYGIMYERIQGNDMYNGATNPPGDPSPTLNNVSLQNPGLTVSGPAAGSTITAANLPALPLGVTGVASDYPAPRVSQYSGGVQQAIGSRAVLNVSYVGSMGRHMNYYQAINLPPLTDLPAEVKAGSLNFETLTYPGLGNVRLAYDGANSEYNSLQTSLNGKVAQGLFLQVGYTLSKAYDISQPQSTGSGGDLQNITNPYAGWRYDWGPSPYDRRNVFFLNFVYDIPLFGNASHLVKATLGGWQISGILTEEGGAPVNIGVSGTAVGSIIANTGPGGSGAAGGTRPNISGPISYPHRVDEWFNTSVFSAPPCLTGPDCYGNLGFDAVRGPGRNNVDLSLFKNFAITERFRAQFRVDAFNTFNHPQFQGNEDTGGLGNNLGSGNFGQITQAYDGRQLQLALKLMF
jgi:carboxypeptidase family protein